jgi:hypothetical protein
VLKFGILHQKPQKGRSPRGSRGAKLQQKCALADARASASFVLHQNCLKFQTFGAKPCFLIRVHLCKSVVKFSQKSLCSAAADFFRVFRVLSQLKFLSKL